MLGRNFVKEVVDKMKVLVMSDTHGRERNVEKVLKREGMPDYVLHLGDSEDSGAYLRGILTCPLEIVAGNCDFFCDLPKEIVTEIGGVRVLMAHGHCHFVALGLRDLAEEARANGCSVAMFGHTHRPLIEEVAGITVINPGSLSFPRQEGRQPSYIVMEVRDGRASYEIKYI